MRVIRSFRKLYFQYSQKRIQNLYIRVYLLLFIIIQWLINDFGNVYKLNNVKMLEDLAAYLVLILRRGICDQMCDPRKITSNIKVKYTYDDSCLSRNRCTLRT